MTKQLSIIVFSFLFQAQNQKILALNSRITCGGCVDSTGTIQVLDVGFRTTPFQDTEGRWHFRNTLQNSSRSTVQFLLVVPWRDCQKRTEGRSAEDVIDAGCGGKFGLLSGEEQQIEFYFGARDAKPIATQAALWIIDPRGQAFVKGEISIYWPDKIDPSFQLPTMGGEIRKITP